MDWNAVMFGVVLGILLIPTLLMLGLRLVLWLVLRKVRKMAKQMEENGTRVQGQGWRVQTLGFGLPDPTPAQEVVVPALAAESTLHDQLCQQFLRQTNLSESEWDEVKDRLVFVHDHLSLKELEEMGFECSGEGTPREQAEGQGQLLGSLIQPIVADVYAKQI